MAKNLLCLCALVLTLVFVMISCAKADDNNVINGVDGKSAYDLAVEGGYDGTVEEWLISLVGKPGEPGIDGEKGTGIKGIEKTTVQGNVVTYTITFTDGTTQTFDIANGINGDTGNGISKIEKTGTSGLVDTYTITFTNSTTATFTITNGEDGKDGATGTKGDTGKSAYDIYCELYDYNGTEDEWIIEYIEGSLVKHTVTFNINGGIAATDFSDTVTVSHGKTIELSTPTKEGYTFLGWYTGLGINDGKFTTLEKVNEDISLIAKWKINKVQVTFTDYYGSTLSIQTIDWGTAAIAPNIPSTVGDYKFYMWDTEFSNVTRDIIVKAVYVPNIYTINYSTDGGTEIEPDSAYFGRAPIPPLTPEKEGYYFAGWYLDNEYTTKYDFSYALDIDTTLYAYFSESVLIYTYEEFLEIFENPSAKYYLMSDINCMGEILTPIDTFSGVLDGGGFTVKNFLVSDTQNSSGLIRNNNGTIKNLNFDNYDFNLLLDITNSDFTSGALVGTNNGVIDNCTITNSSASFNITVHNSSKSSIYCSYIGCMSGRNNGTISNCEYSGIISIEFLADDNCSSIYHNNQLETYIGGIVGDNSSSAILSGTTLDARIIATINSTRSFFNNSNTYTFSRISGVAGVNRNSAMISECSAIIDINTTHYYSGYQAAYDSSVSGFVSDNFGIIENCYVSGSVSTNGQATTNLSGFVACNESGAKIRNCYVSVDTTSTVSTAITNYGGIAGNNAGSIIKSVFEGTATIPSCTNYGYVAGINSATVNNCYATDTSTIIINGTATEPTNLLATVLAAEKIYTRYFFTETLYWDMNIWNISDATVPTLKTM